MTTTTEEEEEEERTGWTDGTRIHAESMASLPLKSLTTSSQSFRGFPVHLVNLASSRGIASAAAAVAYVNTLAADMHDLHSNKLPNRKVRSLFPSLTLFFRWTVHACVTVATILARSLPSLPGQGLNVFSATPRDFFFFFFCSTT
jgi:hypothetical protein